MSVSALLQALQILEPLIEELVRALVKGETPDFVKTLPDPLRSRVALNAKKTLGRSQ